MSGTLRWAGIVALAVGLSGCLIGTSSNVRRQGTYISDNTLREIEPGKTTGAWVRATLGSPTDMTMIEPGHELWKYSYTETRDSSGHIFLLFGGSEHKVTDNRVFIELKDGTVTKTWRG
jgi:outer membrane protein assembly factor BamE (lipoprotein component of BamABCDE complex)